MDRATTRGELTDAESAAGRPRHDIQLAGAADDAAIRRMLRENPMPGWIELSLEREPSVFIAGRAEGHPHDIVVWRVGDRVVGMGGRAVMDVFVDGESRRVGYLGQFRVDRAFRGRLRPVVDGYERLLGRRRPDEEPYDLTSIAEDNAVARRLLEAGLPSLPRYRLLDRFITRVLPVPRFLRRSAPRGLEIVHGSAEHLAEIATCLFRNYRRFDFARVCDVKTLVAPEYAPALAVDDFHLALRGTAVVGCLALWDQTGFKQLVARGYAPALRRWRPLVNLLTPILGTGRLPEPGEVLPQAFLSHVAIDGDNPSVFDALLRAALRRAAERKYQYIILGFSVRHPLLIAHRARWRAREYASRLYAVHWPADTMAVEELGRRPAHPEVALL